MNLDGERYFILILLLTYLDLYLSYWIYANVGISYLKLLIKIQDNLTTNWPKIDQIRG